MRNRTSARRSRSAQLARGAVGICCQKTDEAAAFVDAGIADVLVTNEVVAPAKIARLAELARARDDRRARRRAARRRRAVARPRRRPARVIDVYVEVDVGAHRCGVAPGARGPCARRRHRPRARAALSRPAGVPGRGAAPARARSARAAIAEAAAARATDARTDRRRRHRVRPRDRRRHRHVAARTRFGRLRRAATGLLRVHGRRLRTQRRRRRPSCGSSRACTCSRAS